jgi:hypothetical protein
LELACRVGLCWIAFAGYSVAPPAGFCRVDRCSAVSLQLLPWPRIVFGAFARLDRTTDILLTAYNFVSRDGTKFTLLSCQLHNAVGNFFDYMVTTAALSFG